MPSDSSKSAIAWAALAAVLAMLPYAGLALGTRALYFEDAVRFDVPMTKLVGEALCDGRLPLWNPYVGAGTPLVTDTSLLPVYPGRALGCALSPAHALGLMLVLQLGLLAAGATLLLRALAVPSALAVGAGAALALSGPAPSWMTSPAYLVSLSFFPWSLLFAYRLGQGRGRAAFGLGASVGLATLGGDVPGTLFAAAGACVVWLGARAERERHAAALRADVLRLAGAGALALAIGAGAWMPLSWFLGRSIRGAGLSPAEAGQWSLHPGELLGLFFPHPLGLPLPEFTFWPFRAMKRERLFVHSLYVGATLAGFGLWGFVRERRQVFLRWAGPVALALFVLATGSETPLWAVTQRIFTYFRYPSKLMPYAVMLVGVAGAVAMARTLERPRRLALVAGSVALLSVLGVALGPPVQAALAERAGAPTDVIQRAGSALREDAARAAVLAALVAVVVLWHARRRVLGDRVIQAIIGGLLALDAAAVGASLNWTSAPAPLERPSWVPERPPWGPRTLRSEIINQSRVGLTAAAYRAEQERQLAELLPIAHAANGIGAVLGYGMTLADPTRRIADLYDADGTTLAEVTGCDLALAPTSRRLRWAASGMASGRLQVATVLPGAVVFSVPRALPRAFLTPGARVVAPGQETAALVAAPSEVIVTAGDALAGGWLIHAPPPGPLLLRGPGPVEKVDPVAWLPERVAFEVKAPEARLLVVLDAFAEGWRAFLDGQEVPILRANSVGRAVIVPAGTHRVEMSFAPAPLVVGPLLGGLALLGTGLAAVVLALRARRRAAPQASPGG